MSTTKAKKPRAPVQSQDDWLKGRESAFYEAMLEANPSWVMWIDGEKKSFKEWLGEQAQEALQQQEDR